MTRLLALVFVLALLTGSAFATEAFLRALSSLFGGGGAVDINMYPPRRGYSLTTPNSAISVGYGYGR
ncbi:uncharacterized protein Dana_GF27724 [Drosophila ananassae]|uniref:Uncharacterized protein n=1 Tax=Drosophila ananassae TaxID=7217 RepID=A0A0P8YCI4_DROAN|nr:uncharacterized protein Dana_GF27724 [Drosophila ananassae]